MNTLHEQIHVYPDRATMGAVAAHDIAEDVRLRLSQQDRVRMVFAAAPSQNEVLSALLEVEGIDWRRVDAFHMDEYMGLDPGAPERFGSWLRRSIFDRLPFGSVNLIEAEGDIDAAMSAYAAKLASGPVDIVCCGIGVNGHIAFNDPPVADFEDPADVKLVELDFESRQQQVDDGCFAVLDDVPTHAVTLTIPRLLRAESIYCVVPGAAKANAVAATFREPIGPKVPATALRTHANCQFYFDAESAEDLA